MHWTTEQILGTKPHRRAATPARTPLCVYEGGIIERCHTCNSEGRHVRECDIHGTATRDYVSGKVKACTGCEDRILEDTHPNIVAADRFMRSISPYPTSRFNDRGIVIVGGDKYWPSVYVTLRMLQHVRCTLPVQVWHTSSDTPPLYIDAELVDAGNVQGFPDPTKRNGPLHPPYQLKTIAAMGSPFEEVLVLDADSYPCIDPTSLFGRPEGAVFWPDREESWVWTRWADWGVKPFGPPCSLEVGQYIVNKRIAWKPFNLMHWYDQHGDWCYGWGIHHDHGDKGPPRVAFAKCKHTWAMSHIGADWRVAAFVHRGFDGSPAFVHRCQSKFVLHDTKFDSTPQLGANRKLGLPLEDEAFRFLEELR